MFRVIKVALMALLLVVGGLLAADAEVVKYADKKLIVKVEGKERTITFAKGRPHLHAADGALIKVADYPKYLKPGVEVELEESNGKVVEILLKK
ncbi:MAG: hypothetical protein U0840_19190 [Gemmataceae bacterium]